jgi:general stress protein CsbA
MQPVPSLPAEGPLRAFVIWASLGLGFLLLSACVAAFRKRGNDLRYTALPLAVLAAGMLVAQYSEVAHTTATWLTVIVAGLSAYQTKAETSFFLFLGGLSLAAAGIIASTQLF